MQIITSGDYLKQSVCFVVEREKNSYEKQLHVFFISSDSEVSSTNGRF